MLTGNAGRLGRIVEEEAWDGKGRMGGARVTHVGEGGGGADDISKWAESGEGSW